MKRVPRLLFTFFGLIAVGFAISFILMDDTSKNTLQSEILPTDYEGITFRVEKEEASTYNLHAMYPITPNDKINKDAELTIQQHITDFKNKLATRASGDKEIWDLNINGDVDYYTDKVVNFVYDGKQYTGQTAEVELNRLYDITTGDVVKTASLFKDDTHLNALSDEARKQLPALLGAAYSKENVDKGTEPIESNFDQFELKDKDSFTMVFEPGQVAAVEKGIVKVGVPETTLTQHFSDTAADLLVGVAAAREAQAAAEKAERQKAMSAPPQTTTGTTDCAKEKCIALTFDDGPGKYGNELLDVLDQYNVKASFFYIGRQVSGYSSEIKRAHSSGHDIGNHTWDHSNMKHETDEQLKQEVESTNQAITQVTGVRPVLLRPPYGAYNDSQLQVVNMPFILWNIDPNDWKDKNADTVYERVMSSVGSGKVVLSHEIYDTTLAAYKRIIPDLINQGYTLVSVTDLFDIDTSNPSIKVYRNL